MYSWEINNVMQKYRYHLPIFEYIKICTTSPQLYVRYNVFNQDFEAWDLENNYWRFTVYH